MKSGSWRVSLKKIVATIIGSFFRRNPLKLEIRHCSRISHTENNLSLKIQILCSFYLSFCLNLQPFHGLPRTRLSIIFNSTPCFNLGSASRDPSRSNQGSKQSLSGSNCGHISSGSDTGVLSIKNALLITFHSCRQRRIFL